MTRERDALRRTIQAERLEAVTTLVSGLAHEIRNPLNSAMLQLDVLETRVERGQTDAESILQIVANVRSEMQRLGSLMNDFLNFAQPRVLDLRRVDLNELLSDVARAERGKAARSEVKFELELDPRVGQVEVDIERIRQAVSNLVENAIEAAREGGHVWLRCRRPDSGANVTIEVEDNGVGFPEGAPIFDAFFTTKPEGTGLGLPIAHRAARDHGGTLDASTAEGRTRFTLVLPQSAR